MVCEAPHIRHERAVRVLVTHFAVWLDRHGGEPFAGAAVEIGEHQLVPDVSFVRPDADGIYHTIEHTSGTLLTEQAPGLETPVAELFATG